jgi:hypothetical protein
MLLNAHRDTHRRSWRRETPVAEVPDAHHRDPVTLRHSLRFPWA